MDKKFEGVIKNAKIARDIQAKMQASDKFNRTFHIRPNSGDFTIVSTLPFAPMRGKSCKDEEELERTLNALNSSIKAICDDDETAAQNVLRKFGFEPKAKGEIDGGKSKEELEEHIQVKFIRGMINGEPEYQGIQFLASEFIVRYRDEDQKLLRADVVGYDPENETLYVFELKKGRGTDAIRQAQEYVDVIRGDFETFSDILLSHPNIVSPPKALHQNKIVPVAVLRYAENITEAPYKKPLAECPETRLWFYRDALSFQKVFQLYG